VATAEKEIIERSRVRQQCPISEFGGCCSPSFLVVARLSDCDSSINRTTCRVTCRPLSPGRFRVRSRPSWRSIYSVPSNSAIHVFQIPMSLISQLSDFHLLSHPAGKHSFIRPVSNSAGKHSAGERSAGIFDVLTGSGVKTNKHQWEKVSMYSRSNLSDCVVSRNRGQVDHSTQSIRSCTPMPKGSVNLSVQWSFPLINRSLVQCIFKPKAQHITDCSQVLTSVHQLSCEDLLTETLYPQSSPSRKYTPQS
jgi:hypothetical protein